MTDCCLCLTCRLDQVRYLERAARLVRPLEKLGNLAHLIYGLSLEGVSFSKGPIPVGPGKGSEALVKIRHRQ